MHFQFFPNSLKSWEIGIPEVLLISYFIGLWGNTVSKLEWGGRIQNFLIIPTPRGLPTVFAANQSCLPMPNSATDLNTAQKNEAFH